MAQRQGPRSAFNGSDKATVNVGYALATSDNLNPTAVMSASAVHQTLHGGPAVWRTADLTEQVSRPGK